MGCARSQEEFGFSMRNHQRKNPSDAEVFSLVTLKTKQVETLFGELEFLEPRLIALGMRALDRAPTFKTASQKAN